MLKIEFILNPTEDEIEEGNFNDDYILSVNNIIDASSYSRFHTIPVPYALFKDQKVIDILTLENVTEIEKYFTQFSLMAKQSWCEEIIEFRIYFDELEMFDVPNKDLDNLFEIEASLVFDLKKWAQLWPFKDFLDEIIKTIEQEYPDIPVYFEDYDLHKGFENCIAIRTIFFRPKNDSTLKEHLEEWEVFIKECIAKANKVLVEKLNTGSFITYFNFPAEIKTACNQYLIYFTQFMSDMGIAINSEIVEEFNQTLFRVTPKDKTDALAKIKEALEIYLGSPASKDFEIISNNYSDIAIQHWKKKIHEFKGDIALANMQLEMSKMMIDTQNATIEAQRSTIQTQNFALQDKARLLSEQINLSHYQHPPFNILEINEQPIVTLKEYDGKWFSINLPKIFNLLKRRFAKK